MKSLGSPVEPVHDGAPSQTLGKDFEPPVQSSEQKVDNPPNAFNGPKPPPPHNGHQG